MSSIWSAIALINLVAHSPAAGFLGQRPRKYGLKKNKYFPPRLSQRVLLQVAFTFSFQESTFFL